MLEEEICKNIINVVLDKKAQNINLFRINEISLLADYTVLCSGTSSVQIRAIADEIIDFAKANDVKVFGSEGLKEGAWILIDLGTVIVHVMNPIIRQFYNLERLWDSAENTSVDDDTNLDSFLFKDKIA